MSETLISIKFLQKSYAGARVLDGVSLDIAPGEIHGLCGENGAGKSTLIKILAGSVTPDAGHVLVAGKALTLGSVRASEAAGIAVIHQESVAFPHLNARDNIFVGREPRRLAGLLLDRTAMRDQTAALLARLGESIDRDRPVGELPLAQRQMVGIARALSHQCRLLIMDEPTASLSERETLTLFRIMRQLKADGVSILYVSHRLQEMFQLANRVTILRDGKHVATRPTRELSPEELIRLMVGRELLHIETDARKSHPSGGYQGAPAAAATSETPMPAALEVRHLTRTGVFKDISFQLHRGEILAMAGLVGAGRSEVARAIFGADSIDSGEVLIAGKSLPPNSIHAALRAGIALVPEDRQHLGLVLPMSVAANMTMAVLPALSRLGLIRRSKQESLARQMTADLRIKTPATWTPVQSLSGGNQQKVVIGKWLAATPKVLILDEPTRGVDVGAKAEIYQLIRKLAAEGMAILLISSDLPEVLLLSDRVLVMRAGEVAAAFKRAEATQEQILAAAMPEGTRA